MAMPGRGGIINCNIADVHGLHACFMPYVVGGGLFVQSRQEVKLGQEVFVAVNLPGVDQRLPLNGKVIWINYRDSAQRPAGFGVQLPNDATGQRIKAQIQSLLSKLAGSDKPTFTL